MPWGLQVALPLGPVGSALAWEPRAASALPVCKREPGHIPGSVTAAWATLQQRGASKAWVPSPRYGSGVTSTSALGCSCGSLVNLLGPVSAVGTGSVCAESPSREHQVPLGRGSA